MLKFIQFYLWYVLSFIFANLFVLILSIIYSILFFDHQNIFITDMYFVMVILLNVLHPVVNSLLFQIVSSQSNDITPLMTILQYKFIL